MMCILSRPFFKLYSEAIVSESEILPRCIIGNQYLNSLRYADDRLLSADIGKRTTNLLQKVA